MRSLTTELWPLDAAKITAVIRFYSNINISISVSISHVIVVVIVMVIIS